MPDNMPETGTIPEGYFGLCPHCHKTDGWRNVGRDHWFFCAVHHTKWYAGSGLFTDWRYESDYDHISNISMLMRCTLVEPFRPEKVAGSVEPQPPFLAADALPMPAVPEASYCT